MKNLFIIVVTFGAAAGIGYIAIRSPGETPKTERGNPAGIEQKKNQENPVAESPEEIRNKYKRVEFSRLHPAFRFSAEMPLEWEIEFVPEITALNVYAPVESAETIRDKSQIFIRFFEANQFLTLSTVDILKREPVTHKEHAAVRYEIVKKAGVPDLPHQPSWRNRKHRLIDIRFTRANPSLFYVFASAPALSDAVFEAFLESLTFHNDRASLVLPLESAEERATKKPFGIRVSPGDSPISPERFSGYHTGVDFEIRPGEEDRGVAVRAFCGGKLRQKQSAAGYGGVLIQDCLLEDQPVTVVYGHLALASISAEAGVYLAPSDPIGILGKGQSSETDGERKHLHISTHKGTSNDLRGYVPRQEDLASWIDPLSYMKTAPAEE